MGRMVEPPRRLHTSNQESFGGGEDKVTGGDGFLERVVKYVPAEIIAAYLTLDRIVAGDSEKYRAALKTDPPMALTSVQKLDLYLPEVVFAGMLLMVFVYFRALANFSDSPGARQTWFKQALVSAVVFIVWAYAMRGSFFVLNDWFVDKYAAMMVPIFTLLSGMFRPSPTETLDPSTNVVAIQRPTEKAHAPAQNPGQIPAVVASQPLKASTTNGAAKHPLSRKL